PSITHNGSVVPLNVAWPRITTAPLCPGCAEPGVTCTPGAFALNIFSTDGVVISRNSSPVTTCNDPVRLSLFCVEYPVTTTSSSAWSLSCNTACNVLPSTTAV